MIALRRQIPPMLTDDQQRARDEVKCLRCDEYNAPEDLCPGCGGCPDCHDDAVTDRECAHLSDDELNWRAEQPGKEWE